jgi:hypothetical protein
VEVVCSSHQWFVGRMNICKCLSSRLGDETLQVRRVKIRLVLLYKIQQGLVAIPAETYLVPGDTRTRGEHKFRPPNVRKDIYQLVTNLAARLCTFSTCWMFPEFHGSHVEQAYSKVGLTSP